MKQYLQSNISLWIMAGIYILAGLNHFIRPGFYLHIMPPYLPYHKALVYLSGAFEVLLGAGLLWPVTQSLAAWGIIAMLLAFMPVHIYMLQSDGFASVPDWLLWARLPLQALLIYWAYQFTQ